MKSAAPSPIRKAEERFGGFSPRIILTALFVLMWVQLLPAIIGYDFPQRDAATRYAPMAEAFACGDWQFAFHPRVTPLLPVCGGIISKLFACNGYLGCQLASSLLLTLGLFPLYLGCKKLYSVRIALASCVLYAICTPLLRLGYYGLRESGVIFGITLLLWAFARLYSEPRKMSGFLIFSAGEAFLLLSRGDVALFAAAAWVTCWIWDIVRNRIPWRSLVSTLLLLALLSPCLSFNYRMVGYPVTDFRHALFLNNLCRKIPGLSVLEYRYPQMPLIPEAEMENE